MIAEFAVFALLALPIVMCILLMQSVSAAKAQGESGMMVKVPRLPVWKTVGNAYTITWQYRKEFLNIARWWLVLMVSFAFLYSWIIRDTLEMINCTNLEEMKATLEAHRVQIMLASVLPNLMHILVGASIAVAWHRLILRDERIPQGRYYLRYDSVVKTYFIFGVAIFLLESIQSFFNLMVKQSLLADSLLFSSLSVLTVCVFSLLVSVRLTIILPAKALELENVTLKDVWYRTSGNFWRIFFGYMLCILPFIAIAFVSRMGCGNAISESVTYVITVVLGIVLLMPVFLSFLSLSYQHFFENSDIK